MRRRRAFSCSIGGGHGSTGLPIAGMRHNVDSDPTGGGMTWGPDDPAGGTFDPPALPSSASALPSFDDIPQVLRQVLVVDDNETFRAFLRGLLQGQGFTVYEAGNG